MKIAIVSRPPSSLAVVALAAIIAITAGWWTLALWPLDATAPEWVIRTREICFGASHTGLPHLGGWLLLIGEPVGMFAVLFVVWGGDVRAGLARFNQRFAGKLVSAAVVLLCVVGLVAAGQRVASAAGSNADETFALSPPLGARGSVPAEEFALLNQHGGITRLADYRGRWVMVTFAFGHCEDICPVIVQHARRARADEGAEDVPILVMTIDPWRDTPDRLATIALGWELGTDDRVLSGSVDDVNATLDAWKIPRQRNPDTGDVMHGSVIVVVDPEGREAWRIEGAPQRVREALKNR